MENAETKNLNSKNKNVALFTTLIISSLMILLFWYIKLWKDETNNLSQTNGKGFTLSLNTPSKAVGKEMNEDIPKENNKVNVDKNNDKDVVINANFGAKPTIVTSKVSSPVVEKASTTDNSSKSINPNALLPAKKSSDNSKETTKGNGGKVEVNNLGDAPIGYLPNQNRNKKNDIVEPNGMLNITGWTWTNKPNVNDDSDETGIIKFRIKVDSDGDVVDVTQIESTVSPAVAQQYKRAVQRTKFRPTSDGDKPDISTGTVTFKLNAR